MAQKYYWFLLNQQMKQNGRREILDARLYSSLIFFAYLPIDIW